MRVKVNAVVVALGAALPLAAAVQAQAATDRTGATGATGVAGATGATRARGVTGPAEATAPTQPMAATAGLTRVVSGQVGVAKAAAGGVGFARAVMGRAGTKLGQAASGIAGPAPTSGIAAPLGAAAGPRGPVQTAVRGLSAEVTRARGALGQHTADQGTAGSPAEPQRAMYGQGADVVFAYDPPQIADDANHVTWHWSLVNKGSGPASHVILVHRFNRPLDKIKASAPCEVVGKMIRCRFDSVPAGGRQEGTIEGDIPSDVSGTVQINGRITWQQGINGLKPGGGTRGIPSAMGAGQTRD